MIAKKRNTEWPLPEAVMGISDHQRETLAKVFSSRLGILCGGPGVGKTRTAAAALRAIVSTYGAGSVAVCAPTGKAAVRITEAMQANGVAIEAKTIHRTLGVIRNGHDGEGWGFEHNASKPLSQKFIAVDEVSMLDVDLASNLFAALSPGAHVLLIGDPGQLPPVGHGAPLRDLLAAGSAQGELTEVHRNGGDIVRACHAIRAGHRFAPSRTYDYESGANLWHFQRPTASLTLATLEKMLTCPPDGIDAAWDCQILVAVNEKSELSRKKINGRLQSILNGGGRQIDGQRFRENDKVICLSNQVLPTPENERQQGRGAIGEFVPNGEIGEAVEVEKGRVVVRLSSPNRFVVVKGEFLNDWDLGYAITVHKSQGSQWPVVFYLADDYPGARRVCCRELVYTALSRAEKVAVTIGKAEVIDQDCRRLALQNRKTFLRELLTQ